MSDWKSSPLKRFEGMVEPDEPRTPNDEERRLLTHLRETGAFLPQDAYQPTQATIDACIEEGWVRSFAHVGGHVLLSETGTLALARADRLRAN